MSLTVNGATPANTSGTQYTKAGIQEADKGLWEDYEKQAAQMRENNINKGEAGIQRAKELHDEFTITMQTNSKGDKTGNVVITLNEDITLAKVKHYLGIPNGVLLECNREKIEKLGTAEIGDTGVQTHDLVEAPKGMQFVIPGGCLNPQQTAWQKICEFFGF